MREERWKGGEVESVLARSEAIGCSVVTKVDSRRRVPAAEPHLVKREEGWSVLCKANTFDGPLYPEWRWMGIAVAKRRERGRPDGMRARRVTSRKVHILKSCTRGFVDLLLFVQILEHRIEWFLCCVDQQRRTADVCRGPDTMWNFGGR